MNENYSNDNYSIFIMEYANEIINAEIICIPTKLVKKRNTKPVINSIIVDDAYQDFIDSNVAKFQNSDIIPDYVICRYDIPFAGSLKPKDDLTDTENVKLYFMPYIESQRISPVDLTTIDNRLRMKKELQRGNQRDYDFVSPENAAELLKKYSGDASIVPKILRKLLANPFTSFNGEEIIDALKNTYYYQVMEINDTDNLHEIGKICTLHLDLAKLRNSNVNCQILHDLLSFQSNGDTQDCCNIIKAYKDNEEVVAKLIEIAAIDARKTNNIPILVEAFRDTAYYKNQIKQDFVQSDIKPFHLLLSLEKKFNAEQFRTDHMPLLLKEDKEKYWAMKYDGLQDTILCELSLLEQRKPTSINSVEQILDRVHKDISYLEEFSGFVQSELLEKYNYVKNAIIGNDVWIENKEPSQTQFFSVEIENKKSIIQELARIFKDGYPVNSNIELINNNLNSGEIDRNRIERDFLNLHNQCQIEQPVFSATLKYPQSDCLDEKKLKEFMIEYMTCIGYGNAPCLGVWDKESQSLNILSLNIQDKFGQPYAISTLSNVLKSNEVISELETIYNLSPLAETKENIQGKEEQQPQADIQSEKEISGQESNQSEEQSQNPEEKESKALENISDFLEKNTQAEQPPVHDKKKNQGKKK